MNEGFVCDSVEKKLTLLFAARLMQKKNVSTSVFFFRNSKRLNPLGPHISAEREQVLFVSVLFPPPPISASLGR